MSSQILQRDYTGSLRKILHQVFKLIPIKIPTNLFGHTRILLAYKGIFTFLVSPSTLGLSLLAVENGIKCHNILTSLQVDAYPQYAASALAGNGFVRSSFAGTCDMANSENIEKLLIRLTAAFPLFGLQMYNKLGYHWATSLLAFLTILMMPFPWIFFKYGKVLRGKSKFALAA